jgi:alanyl-tRNA synthetase
MATILQGVENLYEIDTSRAVLDRASALSGVRYGADQQSDVRRAWWPDHARTAVMLVATASRPATRAWLRAAPHLRRTVRSMKLLGAGDPRCPRWSRRPSRR